jgi:hypothetical protein
MPGQAAIAIDSLLLIGVLAERLDRPAEDFEPQAFTAAILAVWQATVTSWMRDDGAGDLLTRLDRGIDFLIAGCPL